MKFAIYGRSFNESFSDSIIKIFKIIDENNVEIVIYKEFLEFIRSANININDYSTFSYPHEISNDIDLFVSIGGDGTFLETIPFVKGFSIPVIGINSGRLGFLADISRDDISTAFDNLFNKKYKIEERVLIELESDNKIFRDFNYALNEFTIHKKDSSSMITIHTYVNDEYLNSYWCDGIIVSTPTGSTAYSLSVGGPIVLPNSENLIISPISPHNLTVRPLVLSDSNKISFRVEGRSEYFLASMDYRSETFDSSLTLTIKRANFKVKILKLENQSFFSTLRNKLMWGLDKRN